MIWLAGGFSLVHFVASVFYQFSEGRSEDIKSLYVRTHVNACLMWGVIAALIYKEIFPL